MMRGECNIMANSDIKEHISSIERDSWNKVIADFAKHLGSGGTDNHRLGNGAIPGFSTNDYTNDEKRKLASCEWGALNNPHPATHPYTMITGLGTVAHTNNYNDLDNLPIFPQAANGCDAATVTGIRITIGNAAPGNPINYKELWVNTNYQTPVAYVYVANEWKPIAGVFGKA